MIGVILEKFDTNFIKILNEKVNEIQFLKKEESSSLKQTGCFIEECYEFDFHKQNLCLYLDIIFEKGYYWWFQSHSGALRRYVWESFFREFIYALIKVSRIDTRLIREAQVVDLNKADIKTQDFLEKLFGNVGNSMCASISLRTELSKENLPKSLGYLDKLYNEKLDELKVKLTRRLITHNLKSKYYNELRKLKHHYKYEYTLSELVNYCIHSTHFESFFKYNSSRELKQEYYKMAKELILEFLEKYNIKLKKYQDSLNCTHYFLTHPLFERIKSVCLQICVSEIQIKSLEHYKEFKQFYSKCPICGKENINQVNCEKIYFSNKFNYFKETLIEGMHQAEALAELNNKEHYFGIPCEECFYLARNIQGDKSDLENLEIFLQKYRICPVCSNKNHSDYLISFYYDESKKVLRESLIKRMKQSEKEDLLFKIQLGIPCCKCYEEIFGEKPEFINQFF
ncbi:MAG: hypothetical protein BAJALOKI3v1_410038 [Promethearchaeota archaeon]|nr:MAG: hypothetical protein BAJALOKI3v1_410038 [Candidatus Lokiarchaeota archaeon]